MQSRIQLLTALFFVIFSLPAQQQSDSIVKNDTVIYWKFNGTTNLTFSQVNLSNWSAGGENSYSVGSLLDLNLEYKKKRLRWANNLSGGFGVIQQGESETRKTDDNLDFSTKLGYRAVSQWFYYLSSGFKTQFAEGFKYETESKTKISDFMSPAYINLSLGMEYKPDESFYLLISPVTGKATIVLDDSLSNAGAYGVEAGESIRNEFGASFKVAYKKEIIENINLNTKLELFSNLLEEFVKETDVNWEVLITMKINKFLTANIQTRLIYDDDIKSVDGSGPAIQFKEVFGLGIGYTF